MKTSDNFALDKDRRRAAIATIAAFTANLRTIRRGAIPPSAKQRIAEILRLSQETVGILTRCAEPEWAPSANGASANR